MDGALMTKNEPMTIRCVKCGAVQLVANGADDLIGWEWNTVSIDGVSSTAWRCPRHPSSHDPDHETSDVEP